jgi:protein SCO1/2
MINAKSLFPVLLLVLLIAGSAVYWMEAPMAPQVQALNLTAGTMLSQPRTLPDVPLQTSEGEKKFSHEYAGKWTLLFAGYTNCPDVCPTTLSDLNRTAQLLQQHGIGQEQYRVLFLSIDPERDTTEKLRDYARYFNPGFEAVTAKPSDLEHFTKALGVLYLKISGEQGAPANKYLMDHSTAIILIDPAFRFAGIFSAPHEPQKIADDLAQIFAVYPNVRR